MASLNKTSSGKMRTQNKCGHAAYKMDDKTKLVTMALTTMLGEPKFYGDNTDELIRLAMKLCHDGEGEFVAKLAVWARTKGNMRSVSHALISVVSYNCSGEPFIRPAARAIASMRGDDGTEILATYKALYGDKVRWPHAIQRGVRDALEGSSPFSLAKYQSRNRDMKLRDTLRITHPAASRDDTRDAMGKVVDGTLPMPKGWETELSERGNTKEVWDELIREDRLGTFAKLRNLRNMMLAGADVEPVLDTLEDRNTILKSRILPFRFFAAYKELARYGLDTTRVTRALDAAMGHACGNVDALPGRTAVLIDTSGSMGAILSAKSSVQCSDVAAVLGAMVARVSDDAWVCGFDFTAKRIRMTGMSVLNDARTVPLCCGGTDMGAGFELLMKSDFDADRIIVLSDNEVNGGWYGNNHRTIQSCLERYRSKVGHDVWCHAIDLQGYGTQQFIGPKVNVIAGWSESVLRFIGMAESGVGSIVSEIESMRI
ncbi:MAG: TROVE domain-containing protein [Atopobiaceae bacterium]|nr:TROVE domain-containing protein [Atopobiaceae bacterium]